MDIFYLATYSGNEYFVGNEGCERIEEHSPRGDGDRLFYDVYINNEDEENILIRIFDPLEVRINRE